MKTRVKKFFKYLLCQPNELGVIIVRRFFTWLPDVLYVKILFYLKMGYRLNLDTPSTFSEKLQWLKLYDRNPKHIQMVDKLLAKQYIEDMVGKEYVVPLLGVWNRIEDVDFDKLPSKFVLKTTHDSGGVMICKEKSDFVKSDYLFFFKKRLQTNYYKETREWPYKCIDPRIIAEPLIEPDFGEIKDYKFYCFNGVPKFCMVITNRFSNLKSDFYDENWNHLDLEEPPEFCTSNEIIKRPKEYKKMLDIATILSKGEKFMRVDMYYEGGKIYCGELTFYPCSGCVNCTPSYYNNLLGSWIDLSEKFDKHD